jgi:glycosyltransferase involved in cell wall biosynthesis
MKILFPCSNFYETKEIEFICNDISILKELGHDVKVVIAKRMRNLLPVIINHWDIDLIFSWFVGRGFVPTLLRRSKSVVVAGGADVCSEKAIKYGYDFLPKLRQFMIRYVLTHAALILPDSNHVLNNVIKLGGRNVKMIYLGVKVEDYKPDKELKEDNRLLIISGLGRMNIMRKNFADILKSLKYVVKENPNVKLVIFGRRLNGFHLLEKLIKTTRLRKNIQFCKNLSREQKIKELQKATVYVQPSYHEAFGLAIAEAMSCELPVIVSRKGAIPEVVGNCGIYVPLNKPQILANKILDVLDDEKLRRKLGKRGRKRIKKYFSYKRRKESLKKVLNEFKK